MCPDGKPMRVFIVDDEPPARNRLRELLQDCSKLMSLEVVGEAGNGHEALEKLSNTPADVVLLDIRMPQMNGIEFARHLGRLPRPAMSDNEAHAMTTPAITGQEQFQPKWPPAVIFTTAYDSYAIKAFELHAVDYLLKPIRMKRLLEALGRAREAGAAQTLHELPSEPRKFLSFHERGVVHLVPIGEVLYLRAELKYVTVRTVENEYLLDESLTSLEKEFTSRFIRIHRNCLVAKEAIDGFERGGEDDDDSEGWMVKLKGLKESLAVSRRQQHIIKELT